MHPDKLPRVLGLAVVLPLFGLLAACEQKGAALRIDRVDPPSGSIGGGEQVTITGAGFQPGKTQVEVRFGRRKSEQVTIASPTQITAVTPAGERGPVDVSLMFDNGAPFKIAEGFKYIAPAAGDDVRRAFFSGKAAGAGAPGAGSAVPKSK